MRVAIIGHRSIARSDADVIAYEMLKLISDPDVEELWIPGIDGVSANALCFTLLLREREQKTSPKIFTVFPGKFGERPPWSACTPSPEEWSQRGDGIYELGGDMSRTWKHVGRAFAWELSMRACNEYVVNQVAECGQVHVFWNGSRAETDVANVVEKIQKNHIMWQHVEVLGDEDK